MNSRIYWKLALSACILAWAVFNLLPLSDTPFDAYLVSHATAKQDELKTLVSHAKDLTAKADQLELQPTGAPDLDADQKDFIARHKTFFLSLRSISEDEKINGQPIDFWTYFPGLNASDLKNVTKRNEQILATLLGYSKAKIKYGLDLQGGIGFTLSLDAQTVAKLTPLERQQSLDKVIEIVDKRINGLGVAEPIIRPLGDSSIEVQIPNVSTKDNPGAIDDLKKPAKLEFRNVYAGDPSKMSPDEYPIGYELMNEEFEDQKTGNVTEMPVLVATHAAATGEIIKSAFVYVDPTTGQFKVGMNFTSDGAKFMQDMTTKLIEHHDRFAILLDGKLESAPEVDGVISSQGEISGRFTQTEAVNLANDLNNPLQYGLTVDEVNEVGPTLAAEARASSIKAGLLGTGLVVLFMVGVYYLSGFLSVITLVLNVLITLGVQASIGATLTLPGVAALVLTIGMAVDANILIYERMREEKSHGKGILNSLETGHNRALASILDSHVTSIITAAILIWLGTGPIKGFGVILLIGLIANLFCVLVCNHALLELIIIKGWLTEKGANFRRLIPETKLPFYSYRKIAITGSICVILIGIAAIFVRGDNALGPDFLGGEEVSVHYAQAIPQTSIESTANKLGITQVTASYQTELGTGIQTLKIQTEVSKDKNVDLGRNLLAALSTAYPDAKLDIGAAQVHQIGATVSDSLKWNALIAVALSLLGVMLYVAFRFEVGYAMGAIVATLHDVIITVGVYVLCGGQFTSSMVAAVLMIIGYSLNDTVIVFDRVREELKLNPHLKLVQVLDLAVNKTLARTTLTSMTVFLCAVSLYVFGAGVVHEFALVFMIGIATGTASSIFIANPVFCWWHKGDRRHVEERELLPKYEWDSSTRGAKTPAP